MTEPIKFKLEIPLPHNKSLAEVLADKPKEQKE